MIEFIASLVIAMGLSIVVVAVVFITSYIARETRNRREIDHWRSEYANNAATVKTMTMHSANGHIAGVLKIPAGAADQKMTDARIRLYEGRLRIGKPWPRPDMADRLLRFDASPEANDPYAADVRDAIINGFLDPPATQRETSIVTDDDDWIAAELIAEEHRQGLPVGENRNHCSDCKTEATQQKQKRLLERLIAECTHPETVELRTVDGVVVQELCRDCGTESS